MADLSVKFAGITSPNPFWLASGPPTNTARAGDARVRRRLGRRGVENHRRADREHQFALRRDRSERREDDGLQQYRADQRPAQRDEFPRNLRSEEALSEESGDRFADGGIASANPGTRWCVAPKTPARTRWN